MNSEAKTEAAGEAKTEAAAEAKTEAAGEAKTEAAGEAKTEAAEVAMEEILRFVDSAQKRAQKRVEAGRRVEELLNDLLEPSGHGSVLITLLARHCRRSGLRPERAILGFELSYGLLGPIVQPLPKRTEAQTT